LKDNLAVVFSPNLNPTIHAVKSFGAGSRLGIQGCFYVAALPQGIASQGKQGTSDATALMRRMNE
jgi:hypothetical protein